jgi:hypothetical protein
VPGIYTELLARLDLPEAPADQVLEGLRIHGSCRVRSAVANFQRKYRLLELSAFSKVLKN